MIFREVRSQSVMVWLLPDRAHIVSEVLPIRIGTIAWIANDQDHPPGSIDMPDRATTHSMLPTILRKIIHVVHTSCAYDRSSLLWLGLFPLWFYAPLKCGQDKLLWCEWSSSSGRFDMPTLRSLLRFRSQIKTIQCMLSGLSCDFKHSRLLWFGHL